MIDTPTIAFMVIFALTAALVIIKAHRETRPHLHGRGKKYQPPKVYIKDQATPALKHFTDGVRALDEVRNEQDVRDPYMRWWRGETK